MGKVCFFLTSLVSEHLPLLFFRFEFSSSVPSDAERAFGFGFLAVSSDHNNREDHDDFVDGVDYDVRNNFGFGFLAASSVQRLTINSQHIFFSSKIQTLQVLLCSLKINQVVLLNPSPLQEVNAYL